VHFVFRDFIEQGEYAVDLICRRATTASMQQAGRDNAHHATRMMRKGCLLYVFSALYLLFALLIYIAIISVCRAPPRIGVYVPQTNNNNGASNWRNSRSWR
jgi:hypothetical protein